MERKALAAAIPKNAAVAIDQLWSRSSSRKPSSKSSSLLRASCSSGHRFEGDPVAAVQIGSKHFQEARGRKFLLTFPNRDCALEPSYPPHKERRWSRMQPELTDNLDFSPHGKT
jgi:hypothetical protein